MSQNKRVADLSEIIIPDNDDWIYIIDINDLTESPKGTSKKIKKSNLLAQSELDKKISSDIPFTRPNSIVRVDATGRKVKESLAEVSNNGSINIPSGETYKVNNISLVSDKTYKHIQGLSVTEWNVNHNLGKIPSVSIFDNNNIEYEAEIRHIDNNNTKLIFSVIFSGYAIFN